MVNSKSTREERGLARPIIHASGRKKTVCTSHVLAHFGVLPNEYKYAHDATTVKRVLRRSGYSVCSRASALDIRRNATIGRLRKALQRLDGSAHTRYYVGVVGHAMVLNGKGETVVDTDPRERDRRQVTHVSFVTRTTR